MKYNPLRRKEDRGYGRILTFLGRFFTVIGVAAFISMMFLSLTLLQAMNYKPPSLPDNILLSYKLKANLFETTQKPSLKGPWLRPPTTLYEVVEAIDLAKNDDRVKGLVIDIKGMGYNLAQIQELRDAVHRFRKREKFAMVFANDLGGLSGGMSTYYLATAFDEIWLQPMGMVSITGMYSETPFLKNIMDKVGVTANFDHRGQYKSAMESMTRTNMSKPSREMMTSILNDLGDQLTSGIAKDRGLDEKTVKKLIDGAPYLSHESLENKLVDRLDYYDVFMKTAKKRANDKIVQDVNADVDETKQEVELIDLLGYGFGAKTEEGKGGMVGFFTQLWHKKDFDSGDDEQETKNKIALIYGAGMIVPHKENASSFAIPFVGIGKQMLFADKIASAFHDAADDDDVAVIVFRIDSPGGSPGAAETLRRAVLAAQEKGKKVVVSMGGTAASGGYWAIVDADYIVAEPATLTGSIGVFAGKMVLKDLWEKLGIKWDSVSFGDNSGMWSMNSMFSKTSSKRFSAMLDNIYNSFVERVAKGRGMTIKEVEKIAQGRVWTGKQAKEIGLVDDLGGVEYAISYAKELAGFKKDDDVPILYFPAKKSTLEMILKMLTEGSTSIAPISVEIPANMKQLYSLWTLSQTQQNMMVISPVVAGFNIR